MPKRNPFKCNYCGSDLMMYQIFLTPSLLKQLKEVAQTKASDTFRVQKCENPKCGRTYIWADPQSLSDKETRSNQE